MQREIILTTVVDNSVASTGYSSNAYTCANTSDKIFLLSYKEATNSAYGFESDKSVHDSARRMLTSDYSRAKGTHIDTDSYFGVGYWWLRSPSNYNYIYACDVRVDTMLTGNISYTRGIVPAMWITL